MEKLDQQGHKALTQLPLGQLAQPDRREQTPLSSAPLAQLVLREILLLVPQGQQVQLAQGMKE